MPVTSKIPKNYQTFLFVVLSTSWISGLAFFILNNFIEIEGEYAPIKHPAQYPTLQIHGFAAFIMIMILGYLLATHIKYGWRHKPLKKLGIALLSMHVLLILTAYILYYIADESSRTYVGYFHGLIGLFYPMILILHILSSQKEKLAKR